MYIDYQDLYLSMGLWALYTLVRSIYEGCFFQMRTFWGVNLDQRKGKTFLLLLFPLYTLICAPLPSLKLAHYPFPSFPETPNLAQ